VTEPVEPEDEITESIPRVIPQKQDTHEPEWQEWMNFFLGDF
jgi:hypothetical protein